MNAIRDPAVRLRARQAAIGLAIVAVLALVGQGVTRRARTRPPAPKVAAAPAPPVVTATTTMPRPERDPFAPTMVTESQETTAGPTSEADLGTAPVTVPQPSVPGSQPLPVPGSEPITERSATLPDILPAPPPRRRRNRPRATLPDIRDDRAPASSVAGKKPAKQPAKQPVKPAVSAPAPALPASEWVEPPEVGDDILLEGVVVGSRREARLRVKGNSVPAAEGDLVGGYRIERIDRDEVFLTRNGARYRLTLPGGPRVGGSRAPAGPEPPKLGPPAPPAAGKTS